MAQTNSLPTVLVILGATGDLMRKKLAPSLFRLWKKGYLPALFQVVGFSKDEMSAREFQDLVKGMLAKEDATEEEKERFVRGFGYQAGRFEESEGYGAIASLLGRRDEEWKVCANKLFYLAVPPQFYEAIFRKLDASGLTEPCSPEEGWTRVIVEKPFGKDLKTAQDLDRLLGTLFEEEQIYRMDHYLGKETVQNILAFRFSNSFLEPAWSKDTIEKISVRFLEREGVGDRIGFYDGVGALRDVGQNHVLQMLALFTMEPPPDFTGRSIREKRGKILRTLKRIRGKGVAQHTIRGQYEGYLKEKNVDPASRTETYFRILTELSDENWKGVPIELEGGKGMPEDRVEVEMVFRHSTPCLCPPESGKHYRNILHYSVQPNEGVRITFWVKKPGPETVLEERAFSFDYKEAFAEAQFLDAYERLMLNAIQGDQSSFVSTEEILEEWRFVDPIVRAWQKDVPPLRTYELQSPEIRAAPLPINGKSS